MKAIPLKRKHILNTLFLLGSTLLTLLLLFRRLIFGRGYVIYRDLFPAQLHYPSLWHSQGSFLALENYKFVTYTGLFLPLQGLGLDVYEKVVYVSAAVVAYLAFYLMIFRLLGHLSNKNLSPSGRHLVSALAALTYLANPAAANIFFDFSLFVGYAFAPLSLLLFIEMLEGQRRTGPAVIAIAGVWWASAIKAHWIVFGQLLLLPPLFVWIVCHRRRTAARVLRRNLLATVSITVVYLVFSAYWLIPFVGASQERFVGSHAPITFEAISFLSTTPLRDAVRLLGAFSAWPYVRFGPPLPWLALPWMLASWAIPVMAIAALIWFRRHWQVWTLFLFVLAGVLLSKGVAPPLGEVYTGLVFGDLTPDAFRWLFRVASKWNVFASLGYSGLVAFAMAELWTRVRWVSWRRLPDDRRSTVALLALGGYLLALPLFAWPSFTGDFDGALSPVPLPDSLLAANQWLDQQKGDAKVNWMPVTNGRELEWNQRPSGDLYTSLSARPSIGTNWNRHPVLYYSYAYEALAGGQLANFGRLLSILNTRFVAYHDDVITEHIHQGVEPVSVLIEGSEEELPKQLSDQRDLNLAWQNDFISIYQVADVADPLFVPQRVFLTTGDLALLTSLDTLDTFQLRDNAILFDASRSAGTFPSMVDGLLLSYDAPDHLTFARLPAERMLSPASETRHSAVAEAWSRFDVYHFDWQSVLRSQDINHWGFDYGRGMVAHQTDMSLSDLQTEAVAHSRLNVRTDVPETTKYHVWVRHLRHPRAGALSISLDDEPLAVLPGQDSFTHFDWQDAGAVTLSAGHHVIGLQNHGGFNAVNALVLISEREFAALRAQSQELAARVPNIYLFEIEEGFAGQAEQAPEISHLGAGEALALDAREAICTNLELVVAGNYTVALRAAIPSSFVPLAVTMGEKSFYLEPQSDEAGPRWLTAGPIYLEAGDVQVCFQARDAVVLDALMLYTNDASSLPFQATSSPAEISYEQIDSTRYRVQVRAERPFVLALAETYDPLWVATGPDVQVHSTLLYGVINGFFFERTGSYEIIVGYEPQQWARLGTLLSALALIAAGPLVLLMRSR